MSRSLEIDEGLVKELLNKNCGNFLTCPIEIFRRYPIDIKNENFYQLNPGEFHRSGTMFKSTGNIHHLLLENLVSWQGFPKRSKSIIGSTSKNTATIFGNSIYRVIPFDNCKIAISPTPDNNIAFDKSLRKLGLKSSSAFIYISVISEAINNIYQYLFHRKVDDSSWKSTKVALCEIEANKHLIKNSIYSKVSLEFKLLATDNLESFLDNVLNPLNNEFKLISNYLELNDTNREVWTDSKCLLIKHDLLEKLLNLKN